ncbi:MAG: hypothetical protein LBQ33_00545 [Oscillospiraceae bacterium]|nr:hypothetical protein [Oscillospiraceae bacterium]
MRPGNAYRLLISLLLTVSLCSAASGLRSVAALQAASVMRQAEGFLYRGVSREASPTAFGAWMLAGKYRSFTSAAQPAFPVPGLAQGYVPQGIVYLAELDCFALSSYFPGGGSPSLLSIVDAKSGVLEKSIFLHLPNGNDYTGHAGGLAAWGKHVWVTSDGNAYRLALKDIRKAGDGAALRFREVFSVGNRAGFAYCTEEVLWIGEFYADTPLIDLDPAHTEAASGNSAWCCGFRLNEKKESGLTAKKRLDGMVTPDYVLSVPDYVQGMCEAPGGELLLSCSYATQRPAWLLVYPPLARLLAQPPKAQVRAGGAKRPLWVLGAENQIKKQIMPPMSEGLALRGEMIYILFESAAAPYRAKAELAADYVFRMALPVDEF